MNRKKMINYIFFFQTAVGGALGVVSRVLISFYINRNFSFIFSIVILAVKLTSSFVISLIMGAVAIRNNLIDNKFFPFFATGFLGGFATFSSFSLEALYLFQDGKTVQVISYIGLTVMGCLIGVYIGAFLLR